MTKTTIRFNAEIESRGIISLPKTATAKLPFSGKTKIEGAINSMPFRAVLESGKVRLGTTAQNILKKNIDEGSVEITKVGDETETRVPADFAQALKASPKAHAIWKDITPLARRDWIFWIIGGKKAETRAIRIGKGCSKLSSGMRRVCCFAGVHWLD